VLLAAGADINARTNSGRTPFNYAIAHDHRRAWPLFLRAGAEIPTNNTDPYFVRVRNAGGFKRYEQAHILRITAILAPTPRLPPEMVRKIVEFWLHAGHY
jgi:ankyrin repeat protein